MDLEFAIFGETQVVLIKLERKRSFLIFSTMLIETSYMNFAHGDEPLEEIYGESLPRLKELKRQWDPQGRFNQWFPIV